MNHHNPTVIVLFEAVVIIFKYLPWPTILPTSQGVLESHNGGSLRNVWSPQGSVRLRNHKYGTATCEGPYGNKEMG